MLKVNIFNKTDNLLTADAFKNVFQRLVVMLLNVPLIIGHFGTIKYLFVEIRLESHQNHSTMLQ